MVLSFLSAFNLNPVRAGTSEPRTLSGSTQFRITHLAFDAEGNLGAAPESLRPGLASFLYGEPVTNVVLRTGPPVAPLEPGESSVADEPEQRGPDWNAPPRPARSQYRVDRWSLEHGLPGNKVNALLQTRDGYLWVGTVGGLARFDGVRFTVFNESNTPEMERNGSIGRALFEDASGRLWIGTERGLLCYSGENFVSFSGQAELRGGEVRCFAPRSAGGFWIGAGQRLGYWDGSTIRWRDIGIDPGKFILALAEDAGGMLWIGTMRGLFGFDLGAERVTRTLFVEDRPVAVAGLILDRRGRLWIGSRFGTWRLERGGFEPVAVTPQGALPNLVNARFAEDAEGSIWATTSNSKGVVRFRHGSGEWELIPGGEELAETICIFADREGAVWVGALDRGLFRLRPRVFATLAIGSSRVWDNYRAVTEGADGSLWFSSQFCIGRWSRYDITLLDIRAFLPGQASGVRADPAGRVWAGFPGGGVFEPLPAAAARFREIETVQVIQPRRDGSLWLGTSNGLYRATGASILERFNDLSNSNIRALLEDRGDNLWVGTAANGLKCLSRDGVRSFGRPDGLGSDSVHALHESEDGSLWVGTDLGLGLVRNGRVGSFEPESGLPQRAIHGILEDDFGRLWLGHAAGISRVARQELDRWLLDRSAMPAVADFGNADGLLNPEISRGAQPVGVKSADGRLWFATRGGLVVTDPAECPTHVPAPLARIEQLIADGKNIPIVDAVEIPPDGARNLELRYTATSLHSPEKVRIRYRLEGYDPGWRESGSVREAIYARLRPGHYRFRVQARNHEGRWSAHDAVLAFRIAPHIWQTRWFYPAGGFILTAFAGVVIAWRLRRHKRRFEHERLKSVERERLRIARDMHDHLGAQLAGIALASGDNDSAHRRARETLRELHDLIWSVHPDNDTLPSLVDFIANFAARYLNAAGVALDLDLPDTIPPVAIPSSLRHELAGLFKEAVRNVAQHARAKRVVVRLRIDRGRIVLSVGDDGRGFDPFRVPVSAGSDARADGLRPGASGNGVRNFHVRCARLGGACRIQSASGRGSVVEFSVPLNNRN